METGRETQLKFITFFKYAVDVQVDILCPPGSPLHHIWLAYAKTLTAQIKVQIRSNSGEWRLFDHCKGYWRTVQMSLEKISVRVYGSIDGVVCVWYPLHKELRANTTKVTLGRSRFVNTLPDEPAEYIGPDKEWPKEHVVQYGQTEWVDKAKPWPRDARFDW